MDEYTWFYTLSVATFIFVIIFLVKHFTSQDTRKEPLPPSPLALPIIGHIYLLKNPLHRTLQSLSARYGPVFGLKLGFRYTVVVSSPAAVEECFKKNDVVLADRPQFFRAGRHLNYEGTTLGASNCGEHWRSLRRIANQEIFSLSTQNMFWSVRQDEVRSMVKSLFQSTKQGRMQKVDLKSRAGELAYNIITRIVTGKRYYGDEVKDLVEASKFRKIIRESLELGAASNPEDFLPFLQLIDFGNYGKMLELKKEMDKVLQGFVDEHRRKRAMGQATKTMIDNLLALQEIDSESFSDLTIKGLAWVLITAGTDTTATTTEWAMSLLLNNPDKLDKAQAEIDTIVGLDQLVEESDLVKLPYLQGIVKETLRLYPAAPLLLPHYSSSECTLQGYYIPRGTLVLFNAWAIHRDPEVWDNPLIFKPERFENTEQSQAYKLVPFGAGRRTCPGAGMANKEVGLALASLIQCFEWERIGEEEVDMCEGIGLTLPKLKPLEAMCRPRKSMIKVLAGK